MQKTSRVLHMKIKQSQMLHQLLALEKVTKC
jgi:hypothetical protein